MKNFISVLIILANSVFAQTNYTCYPKKTIHVYYVNGVATKKEIGYKSNWESLTELNDLYRAKEPLYNNFIIHNGSEGYFNQTSKVTGLVGDLIESARQKLDARYGHVFKDEGKRQAKKKAYEVLTAYRLKNPSLKNKYSLDDVDGEVLKEIFNVLKEEINEAYLTELGNDPREEDLQKLYDTVKAHVEKKERVFIYSHSQGNLFVDELMRELRLNDIKDYDKLVGNLRYGSPADQFGVGNAFDIKFQNDVVTGGLGIDPTHYAQINSNRIKNFIGAMFAYFNNPLLKAPTLFFNDTRDITAHGLREWYTNKNVMTGNALLGPYTKNAQDLSVEEVEKLHKNFGDTCDHQLFIGYKDSNGEIIEESLQNYITVNNLGDSFNITFDDNTPLITEYSNNGDLKLQDKMVHKWINGDPVDSSSTFEINIPKNGTALNQRTVNIDFQTFYLERFSYSGNALTQVQLCDGADCCRESDQVYCGGNCLPKPVEGASYTEDCRGPFYESSPVCSAVCRFSELGNKCHIDYDYENLKYIEAKGHGYSSDISQPGESITLSLWCRNNAPDGSIRETTASCSCTRPE